MKAPQLFNFLEPVAYTYEEKNRFHSKALQQLKKLAVALALPAGAYDLRSNKAGIAVSGEVTLHAETVYIQVSQPFGGGEGILFRACQGRKDYTGGRNQFASLDLLNSPAKLAALIRERIFGWAKEEAA